MHSFRFVFLRVLKIMDSDFLLGSGPNRVTGNGTIQIPIPISRARARACRNQQMDGISFQFRGLGVVV